MHRPQKEFLTKYSISNDYKTNFIQIDNKLYTIDFRQIDRRKLKTQEALQDNIIIMFVEFH